MPPEPLATERFVALLGPPGQITDNATAGASGSVRPQIRALLALLRLALLRADALKRLLELLALDWGAKLQSECGRCMQVPPAPAAGSSADASEAQQQQHSTSHEPTFCYYNVCYELVAQLFLHVLQLLRYLLVERSPVDAVAVPLEPRAPFGLSKETLSTLLSTLIHLCHRAAMRRSVLDEEKREEAAAESSGVNRPADRLGTLRKQIKLSLMASSAPQCTHFVSHEFTRRPNEAPNEAALKRHSLLFAHSSWLFSLDELTAAISAQSFSLLVALVSHSTQLHEMLCMAAARLRSS